MTEWQETPLQCRFGVAITNYQEEEPSRLALCVGDTVNILAQHQDWYYGFHTKSRSKKGVFPKCYVLIKEAIINKSGSYETASAKELPIVQEITSVLREWGIIWKDLFMKVNGTKNEDFEKIRKMMLELIDWRRLIMSKKLTLDEMKVLQQKVTNEIDMGNARLGLDLVVRDAEGNIIDPSVTSTISLYRQHELATQRIQEETEALSDRVGPNWSTNFSLYLNVKNFVCHIGEDADVLVSLYDHKHGQFSDNYVLKWSNQGMPKDLEMLHNLRAVFTDLGAKDAVREKVFLVCQVIRIGRMDLKDDVHKKLTQGVRRPFGVAVFDITDIVSGGVDNDVEQQLFVPFQPCGERECLENVTRKLVVAKEINHKGQGLFVTMRKLPGDLQQVQKDYPHLVTNTTAIARKLGFPDVIMPADVRNDLYVTLMQGEFKKGGKTSDKNVEVTMSVCNLDGQVLENVIYEGAAGSILSELKSVVYYHEDKPKWFETVRLAIPINDFYSSHLKFTFKHRSSLEAKDRSEKPFAMSYIKLMNTNGTTLLDTIHELLVYKIDGKRSEVSRDYLSLPETQRELEKSTPPGMSAKQCTFHSGALTLSSNDSFHICTLVCSTKLTHNVDLMGLLKWRDNLGRLKSHLLAFMKVDGEEVVKFIQDTLDALFNILMQNSDSDLYDNLVFDALIFLVGVVSDRKYSQFRPVLDVYIKENFSATLAYNKLMVVLKYYIENAHAPATHEPLLKAMKSLEYIFRFITRSRILFAALNEERGKQQFEIALKQVFHAVNNLMSDATDDTLLSRGATLKYLPAAVGDIVTVLDAQELSHILVELVNSIPDGSLTKQKLHFFCDLVHSPLFQRQRCRRILLPVMLAHVRALIEDDTELEGSVKVLSDVMDMLFTLEALSIEEDLSIVTKQIMRTVIQMVIRMDRSSAHIGNSVAVMTAILRQMTEFHYNEYISHFETNLDVSDFLLEILQVFQDFVKKCVYPSDWNEMIMLQNSVFLKALRYFSSTIKEKFTRPFQYQVWSNFFHGAISFLTQGALQLEDFTGTKRSKIIARYFDIRRETGFEFRSMWYNLGHNKILFIPEMVGPVLEMTLLPETELRKRTIPIFFDMMQCEFMSHQGAHIKHPKRNFHMFENEIIHKLDVLIESGQGDGQYKELFYSILRELFQSHSTMHDQGLVFVETTHQLLQHLLEYRDFINDESRDNRMSCTVNLLNFYHKINRQEMYIRYLHKLCDLHLECDNYTEAAHTLMLYARLLQWSDEPLPTILQSRKFTHMHTHRELKEKLYYEMIEHFDKGKMWEKGIELCKELAQQFETETFDYLALSSLLEKQAEFYQRIMDNNQLRPEPEYFRVGYYGLAFPSFLQNKVFIYRGKEYERLTDFMARLQNQFPMSQLMKTLVPPTEDIKLSPAQYLQINAVSPILELKSHLVNKKVNEQILKYYKVNEVQKFTYSRKVEESVDITKMWLERTNLVSSFPFPGILRWFPVTSTYSCRVSPLEHALETMEATNSKLKMLIDQHRLDPSLRVDPLGMVLNGVVDAAVSGGIANYKIFYTEAYIAENSSQEDNILKLRTCTTTQLVLLQRGLEVHKLKAPENLLPFQAHMEQRFRQMKLVVEKDYGIKLTDELRKSIKKSLGPSPLPSKRVQTMLPTSHSDIAKAEVLSATIGKRSLSVAIPTTALLSSSPRSSSISASPRESPTKVYTRAVSNLSLTSLKSTDDDKHSTRNSLGVSRLRRDSAPSKADRDSVIIELSQELTPMRPLRPETDRKSRPSSTQLRTPPAFSVATPTQLLAAFNSENATEPAPLDSSIDNGCVPTDDPDYDVPPPLPEKQTHADYANTWEEEGEEEDWDEAATALVGPVADKPPLMRPHSQAKLRQSRVNTIRDKPQLPEPLTLFQPESGADTPSASPSEETAPVIPPKHPLDRQESSV